MEGSRGKTPWLYLDNPDIDDFEDGNTDVFKLKPQKSIGKFKQAWMQIRYQNNYKDESGIDGWKCKQVCIRRLDKNGNEKSGSWNKCYDCGWLDTFNAWVRLPWPR